MPIDWFTVVAQAINFLVLVALLRYFLYRPVVRAMDEREERIASRLEEAEEKRKEAESERDRLEDERASLKEERDEILEEAESSAKERREEILSRAREEASEREERWRRDLESRSEDLADELVQRTSEHLASLLHRSLAELADEEVQDATLRSLTRRLGDLEGDDSESLRQALRGHEVTVRCASEMKKEQRERLRGALEEAGAEPSSLDVTVDESIGCGLELEADGYRIVWSARGLAESVREDLRSAIGPSHARTSPSSDPEHEEEEPQEPEETHAAEEEPSHAR